MTKKISFEKISAYRDGEAPPEDRVAIEHQFVKQTEIQSQLLKINKVDNDAKAYFDTLLEQPVSFGTASVIANAFEAKGPKKSKWTENRWLPALAAACFAILISGSIGLYGFDIYNQRLVAEIQATQIARDQSLAILLQDALETKQSNIPVEYIDRATAESFKIIPIKTYKSKSGHWCRKFSERIERNGEVELREGLACRETKGGWHRLKNTSITKGDSSL